ncbi:hypothetical protein RJ639_031723, partial [Escallonia herrerae]
TESCQLDLEFEEADEVMFSVIGPRSVFLTGYYVDNHRRLKPIDESESYGEDIANTESEESNHSPDEDEYEDSFINDADPETFSPSPVSSSGAVDEEVVDFKKPRDKKGKCKRLKKKYQSVESDDDISSWQQNNLNAFTIVLESESEDNAPISSLYKTKVAAENMIQETTEKKPSGKTVDMSNKMVKDDHTHAKKEDSDVPKGTVEAVVMNDEPKSSSFCADAVCIDLSYLYSSRGFGPANGSSLEGSEDSSKAKRRRKQRIVEGDEDNNASFDNICKEDRAKKAKVRCSKQNEEDVIGNGYEENGKKTKKNKKKKNKLQESVENVNKNVTYSNENVNENEDATSSQVRMLSSGLVIEELQPGEPNGKIAASGKKVKLLYIGKLKENGSVIDSNIGKAPYKFRLGAGEVLEGWNVGVDGNNLEHILVFVKLTLRNVHLLSCSLAPVSCIYRPSSAMVLSYGSQGTGENVPPNSWLVYEVELVGVH